MHDKEVGKGNNTLFSLVILALYCGLICIEVYQLIYLFIIYLFLLCKDWLFSTM